MLPWLQKLMPTEKQIRRHRMLKLFHRFFHDVRLWQWSRHSVPAACFIGVFCAFLPLPIQMLIAAVWSIWWRANLPFALLCVWISNPLTWAPLYYSCYRFGLFVLGHNSSKHVQFHSTAQGLHNMALKIWQPLFLGCVVLGFIAATVAYVCARIGWRFAILRRWKMRHYSNH